MVWRSDIQNQPHCCKVKVSAGLVPSAHSKGQLIYLSFLALETAHILDL